MSTTGKTLDPQGVNHPAHYNRHPSGIEVIEPMRWMPADIAQAWKYVLRRGEKVEHGLTAKQTAVKDLRKACWYIEDHLKNCHRQGIPPLVDRWERTHVTELLASFRAHEVHQGVRQFIFSLNEYLLTGDHQHLMAARLEVLYLTELDKPG